MMENIDAVLKRGERLEDLMDRTDNIAQEANIFKRQATDLYARYTDLVPFTKTKPAFFFFSESVPCGGKTLNYGLRLVAF